MFEKKQVPDFQAFLFLPATGSLTNSSRSFWLKQSAVARFWQGQKTISFLASWVEIVCVSRLEAVKKNALEMPQNIWRSKLVWHFFFKMGEMTTIDSEKAPFFFLESQVPNLDSKFRWAVGRWFWWPWCAFKRRISPTKWSFLQTMVIFNCIQHGRCSPAKREMFFWDVFWRILDIVFLWFLENEAWNRRVVDALGQMLYGFVVLLESHSKQSDLSLTSHF